MRKRLKMYVLSLKRNWGLIITLIVLGLLFDLAYIPEWQAAIFNIIPEQFITLILITAVSSLVLLGLVLIGRALYNNNSPATKENDNEADN